MSTTIWQRLQQRWGVSSGWQVLAILCVFACTGFSSLYVKGLAYQLLGFSPEQWSLWQKTLAFILIVLPIYNVLLLMYGWLFGQFRFFLAFEKRMFGRLVWWKK